jgi:hypothetical protein
MFDSAGYARHSRAAARLEWPQSLERVRRPESGGHKDGCKKGSENIFSGCSPLECSLSLKRKMTSASVRQKKGEKILVKEDNDLTVINRLD